MPFSCLFPPGFCTLYPITDWLVFKPFLYPYHSVFAPHVTSITSHAPSSSYPHPYVFRKLWWGSKLIVSHEFPSTLHIPCHNAFAPHFRSITGHAPLTTLPLPCVFSKLRWGSKSITPHSIWHFLDLTCASITVSVHPTSHQSLVMPPHHLAPTPCV